MTVTIRSARASDHSQLAVLFGELDRLHRENATWLLQEPDREPRAMSWLEQHLSDPRSHIFVADAGRCVGLATVYLHDAPSFPVFIPQPRAVLDNLFVDVAWRRSGVARMLYHACEGWARERAASWLEANVYEFNREALESYSALGFQTAVRKLRKPLSE